MKGGRLHIHLVHLEEAKPREMPVQAQWTQDNSQVQLWDTHIPTPISPALFPSLILFLCLRFRCLCFATFSVFYRRPSSSWSWRVSACTVFVSYRQSASLISSLVCAIIFFSLLVCCRHAFHFSTVAHNLVLKGPTPRPVICMWICSLIYCSKNLILII